MDKRPFWDDRMILPFVRQRPTLETLRERATGEVATWLLTLVDGASDVIPERPAHDAESWAVDVELRRFVHEVVTRNLVTRAMPSKIRIHLIELALECVDWTELAGHPRLRGLDWAQARPVRP